MTEPYSIIPAGAIIFETIPHKDDKNQLYAHHAMIFDGVENVIHATVFRGISGRIGGYAGWTQVTPLFEDAETEAGGILSRDVGLYKAIVAYANIPELQTAITAVSKSDALMKTPFSFYKARRPDNVQSEEHRRLLSLFRAFRNATRILTNRPISKEQGVSCVDFTAYIIKTAIINTLFPRGIPAVLLEAIVNIENLKINSNKKLDQVDIETLKSFEVHFKSIVRKLSLTTTHVLMIEELYENVKNQKLEPMYLRMRKQPDLWSVQVLVQVKKTGIKPLAGISFEQAKHLKHNSLLQSEPALRNSAHALTAQSNYPRAKF